MDLKALGTSKAQFERLETFDAPESKIQRVSLTSDEVTALCPVTGQADWYTVTIAYSPKSECLESKSLKLYLHTFRNEGLFCEALAAKIADDVKEALKPNWVQVSVKQKPRGGISIEAEAFR